jgi:molecular chaperone DnaJ
MSGEEVTVRIAPGTPNGRTLRVKGRGITKGSHVGDLLVTVDVQVPQRVDGRALEALKAFAEATSKIGVRERMEREAKA